MFGKKTTHSDAETGPSSDDLDVFDKKIEEFKHSSNR